MAPEPDKRPGIRAHPELEWRSGLALRPVALELELVYLGGMSERRMTELWRPDPARIARSLAPFAASIGRDDTPRVELGSSVLPVGDRPSGLTR